MLTASFKVRLFEYKRILVCSKVWSDKYSYSSNYVYLTGLSPFSSSNVTLWTSYYQRLHEIFTASNLIKMYIFLSACEPHECKKARGLIIHAVPTIQNLRKGSIVNFCARECNFPRPENVPGREWMRATHGELAWCKLKRCTVSMHWIREEKKKKKEIVWCGIFSLLIF